MIPATGSSRLAVRAALVTAPLLAGASMVTQPDLSGSAAHRLAVLHAAPLAAASAALFAVSQLAFLVALPAIGRLTQAGAPRSSAWGTSAAFLGAFAHAVYGGVMLAVVALSRDGAHRAVYAAVVDRMESPPLMLFSVVGLVGTVLGLLVLGIALHRAAVGPHWAGPTLVAFVVVEFAGGAVSAAASYVSTVLLLLVFVSLARVVDAAGQRAGLAPGAAPLAA